MECGKRFEPAKDIAMPVVQRKRFFQDFQGILKYLLRNI